VVTGPNGQQGFFSTERMWLGQGRIESEGEYRARLWSDIELMTLELSRLGVEPRDFAAPYGKINGAMDKLLADAGYDFVYIGGTERNYPGQRHIYRVDAGDTVQSFIEALDILWGKKSGQLTPAA
jgi:peptidoglycan/xylan/chitin deacetylase (PgdA/CDA1 family)